MTRPALTLVLAVSVVLAGCSFGPVGEPPTRETGPAAGAMNKDGDAFPFALERELGTSDQQPNPRMGAAFDQLEGNLTPVEKAFLRLVEENPHNIWPQIRRSGVLDDGTVTAAELASVRDADGDGLIRANEVRAGTDPRNPDTDGDQLLDGWEYAGGVVLDGALNPLPGADPLHKDLYLLVLPVDGSIPEAALSGYVVWYATAPVDNPDDERGITIHLRTQTDDLERYRALTVEDWATYREVVGGHPLAGTRYFLLVKEDRRGRAYGGSGIVQYGPVDGSGEYSGVADGLDHETLHNLVGRLDEEKQHPDDPSHPRPAYAPFVVTNIDIAEEISRDGMLGLPEPGAWRMPDDGPDEADEAARSAP